MKVDRRGFLFRKLCDVGTRRRLPCRGPVAPEPLLVRLEQALMQNFEDGVLPKARAAVSQEGLEIGVERRAAPHVLWCKRFEQAQEPTILGSRGGRPVDHRRTLEPFAFLSIHVASIDPGISESSRRIGQKRIAKQAG